MQGCKNEWLVGDSIKRPCKKYSISAVLTPSTHSAGANGFLVCLMVIDVRQMQIKSRINYCYSVVFTLWFFEAANRVYILYSLRSRTKFKTIHISNIKQLCEDIKHLPAALVTNYGINKRQFARTTLQHQLLQKSAILEKPQNLLSTKYNTLGKSTRRGNPLNRNLQRYLPGTLKRTVL